MLAKIVALVCCILCAWPFFIIAYYNKNSREPIAFWASDKALKRKVKDIQGYNREMSELYIRCSMTFVLTGVICLIHLGAGIALILLECTLGIYVVWKMYKKIFSKYS